MDLCDSVLAMVLATAPKSWATTIAVPFDTAFKAASGVISVCRASRCGSPTEDADAQFISSVRSHLEANRMETPMALQSAAATAAALLLGDGSSTATTTAVGGALEAWLSRVLHGELVGDKEQEARAIALDALRHIGASASPVPQAILSRLVQDAVASLSTPDAGMPLPSAVGVLGAVSAPAVAPELRRQTLEAALAFVRNEHHGTDDVRRVCRQVLVPILVAPSVDVEFLGPVRVAIRAVMASRGREAEALLLIGACFDFLFRGGEAAETPAMEAGARDLRYEPALWDLLVGALRRTVAFNEDPAVCAAIHSQAIYVLQRVVDFTQTQLDRPPQAVTKSRRGPKGAPVDQPVAPIGGPVVFDPKGRFTWRPWDGAASTEATASRSAWDRFVVAFNTLKEFSIHLVEPALAALNVAWVAGTLPTPFVEAALVQALSHCNIGARRLALRTLWQPAAVASVARLSADCLFRVAFTTATDPKLCDNGDRIVTDNDLCLFAAGTTADTGASATPRVDATVAMAAAFYAAVAPYRTDLSADLVVLLRAAGDLSMSRFGLAMLVRVLVAIAASRRTTEGESAITTEVAHAACELLGAVHGRHPPWLEARLIAGLVEGFLRLHGPAVVSFETSPALMHFLALCGPLADAGGSSQGAIDAAGTVGPLGSAVDLRLLRQRLAMHNAAAVTRAPTSVAASTLAAFVQTGALPSAVEPPAQLVVAAVAQAGDEGEAPPADDAGVESSLSQELRRCKLLAFYAASILGPTDLAGAAFAALQALQAPDVTVQVRALALAADLCSYLPVGLILPDVQAPILAVVRTAERWCVGPAVSTQTFDALCAAYYHLAIVASAELCLSPELLLTTMRLAMATQNDVGGGVDDMVRRRNGVRLLHAHISVLAARRLVLPPQAALECADMCLSLPVLRLGGAQPPSALTHLSWGAVCAQHYRAVWASAWFALTCVGDRGFDWLRVGMTALDECSRCGRNNLAVVLDVVALAVAQLGRKPAEATTEAELDFASQAVRLMISYGSEGFRRERVRCSAIWSFALAAAPIGCLAGGELLREHLLPMLSEDEETTQRACYFAGIAVASRALRGAAGTEERDAEWTALRETLLFIATRCSVVIVDHEESEATLAALEPLLNGAAAPQPWRDVCAAVTPAPRAAAVGRCAALAAIVTCAADNAEHAMWAVEQLLEAVDKDPAVTHEPAMPNSPVHRNRLRIWQLLLLLAPLIPATRWGPIVDDMLNRRLAAVNSFQVRRLLEQFTFVGLCAAPAATLPLLRAALLDYSHRPFVIVSFAQLAAMLLSCAPSAAASAIQYPVGCLVRALPCLSPADEAGLAQLMLVQCTSHPHIQRLVGQAGIYAYLSRVRATEPQRAIDPLMLAVYSMLDEHPEAIKWRERSHADTALDPTNLLKTFTPRDVLCVQRLEGSQWLHDYVPVGFFHRIRNLGAELVGLLGDSAPLDCYRWAVVLAAHTAPLAKTAAIPWLPRDGTAYLDYSAECFPVPGPDTAAATAAEAAAALDAFNLQRKCTPWWQCEAHDMLHARAVDPRGRQRLVIVGSLLDNAVNIAGLFRVAEIFAAESVVIPDPKVLKHPHFIAAARSSDLWLPHETVPPHELAAYLAARRRDGYTIAAVEQTAGSVGLQTYKFPERVVLVLGSEGQGIPAPLLPSMDVCLEIPQYGLVRSLNVAATGAIAVYEFTKQRRMGIE